MFQVSDIDDRGWGKLNVSQLSGYSGALFLDKYPELAEVRFPINRGIMTIEVMDEEETCVFTPYDTMDTYPGKDTSILFPHNSEGCVTSVDPYARTYTCVFIYNNYGLPHFVSYTKDLLAELQPYSGDETYAEMIRSHFMKLVPPTDHKFAALHGAVWSGGSFVYVPPGVSVEIPLQSYFRLNAPGAGQFEHTLIIVDKGAYLHFIEGCSAPKYNIANLHAGCVELYVGEDAVLRYSTIENWSKNMYNLNTKRAKVEKGGKVEWISGSFGSHVSYLYPMSVLDGEGSRSEFTSVTFAGKGQNLDTGCKVVHNAPKTSSYVNTRSISKSGGISTFRSSVVIGNKAKNSKSAVSCQSLMLDDISRSDTIPAMDVRTDQADVGHEARIGRISDDAVFYLMSRGLSEEDARALIVSGFADNVGKELPLEYAVEMNNLIRLEMKGSIG